MDRTREARSCQRSTAGNTLTAVVTSTSEKAAKHAPSIANQADRCRWRLATARATIETRAPTAAASQSRIAAGSALTTTATAASRTMTTTATAQNVAVIM